VSRPDIMIFDEPTASLDGDTGRSIVAFVRDSLLNEKRSIILVTHDDRILSFADRTLNMQDGRIVSIQQAKAHEE
jgi:putative ABC transport system ATP-binding protein